MKKVFATLTVLAMLTIGSAAVFAQEAAVEEAAAVENVVATDTVAVEETVEESVAAHMLSDVPLGSFLSSGIDSAVITAVASKLQPGIKAFTVGFNVNGYTELKDAKEISSQRDPGRCPVRRPDGSGSLQDPVSGAGAARL